jgi:hypothetical protein
VLLAFDDYSQLIDFFWWNIVYRTELFELTGDTVLRQTEHFVNETEVIEW